MTAVAYEEPTVGGTSATVGAPKSRPVRIAMVVPTLEGGGLERLVRDLVLELRGDELAFEVFCTSGLGVYTDDLRAIGVDVHDCSARGFRIRGLPLQLIRALARYRPDVIHAHSGTWYPASIARLVLRFPRLLFTDHGRYPPEPLAQAVVERWCLSQTSRYVAVSTELADYVRQRLGLAHAPDVMVNGIDAARYELGIDQRDRLRAEWDISPDELLAVAVGRLEEVKNHKLLLEAFARVTPARPALRMVIAGTGNLAGTLESEARTLGVDDRVSFVGFRSDIPACLNAADLFLISSTTEGLPIALLEAMAAGLPTVSTAVGGIPAVIAEPPAGLLVPSGDTAAFAAALDRLAGDPALRQKLGATARRRVGAYSFREMAAGYARLYLGRE